MADEYTTAAMYGNADVTPDPGNSAPERWTDGNVDADGVAGLVARMASGQLTGSDDFAAKMGDLGGTKDPTELHRQFVATTGGPDQVTPITNPMRPAVAPEISNAPVEVDEASSSEGESTAESPADETTGGV